jgi:dephospho-CoA kinase
MSTRQGSPYVSPEGPRRRREPAEDGIWVIGVTGGMSSGKSTVVSLLENSGALVVSADPIGHQVLDEPEVRRRLEQVFGPEVRGEDGAVDRVRLGRLAFASRQSLERLNAISHPRLLERLAEELRGIAASGHRGLLVLEAALLVEWDLGRWCDRVIAVVASVEARISRAMRQHGLAEEEARQRLDRQLPDEVRVRYADLTLSNDGTLGDLEARAGELIDRLWAQWRASHT